MVAVGEDLILQRQEGPAGVDQVDAGQAVLLGDFLRAQMLLHRHRVIGAALDGGIVGNDQAFHPGDAADAGDHAGTGHRVVVHAMRRQRRYFQEWAAGVEQGIDALTHQQLAARGVLGACRLAAAAGGGRQCCAQVIDLGLHCGAVGFETVTAGLQLGGEYGHGRSPGFWSLSARKHGSRAFVFAVALLLLGFCFCRCSAVAVASLLPLAGEGAPQGRMRGASKALGLLARSFPSPQPLSRRRERGFYSALILLCVIHAVFWNNSRPINMRRISEVPAPISYNLASRHKRPAGYSLI